MTFRRCKPLFLLIFLTCLRPALAAPPDTFHVGGMDSNPLSADAGPVELIVPDDTKLGRSVHAAAAVTLVDGAQPVAASGS